MSQTIGFKNIELIIIDDYSKDRTPEIIKDYCSKYDNIKTYESGKKTGTPGRARNIGINNSNGEYIMFLDHDDCYMKDSVENLYNAILKNYADVAIGKFQTFGENRIVTEDWIKEDVVLNSISENTFFFSINNVWRMIFPKKFLIENKITFPEGVFAEDLTFMIDSFLNAKKIVFINKIVYNFRLRTGECSSTSLSKGIHYLNGLIDGYVYTYKVLEKNNACKYYDTIFNQHLSCWLNDLILSNTITIEEKKELIKKSVPLFKKIDNVNPFPENNDIKKIIEVIKTNDLENTYILMEEYKNRFKLAKSRKDKIKEFIKKLI